MSCERGSTTSSDRAEKSSASAGLAGEINRYSMSTVCDKRELFWPRHFVNFKLSELARLAVKYATR